jgi:signal transduction histidine kinase
VSHELRTPLATIQAHLDELLAYTGSEAVDRRITVIRRETGRLTHLVGDLFTLSRVETKALQLDLRPLDVAALIHRVVDGFQPIARRERRLTLAADVPTDLPEILADPDRVEQMLGNLLRNALRYTPEGGIVMVHAQAAPLSVEIAVSDSGTGIPAEDLPHIFERFFQRDPSRARDGGGAGLGLSIVRELALAMGGEVRAESAEGEGTRVSFTLPRAHRDAAHRQPVVETSVGTPKSALSFDPEAAGHPRCGRPEIT